MRPLRGFLLIELPNKATQTKSGIHIPERNNLRDSRTDIGKVLALGPEVKEVAIGDYILYRKMDVEVNGKPFHPEHLEGNQKALVNKKDVLAVVEAPPEEYRI